jgi:hypothetical protein
MLVTDPDSLIGPFPSRSFANSAPSAPSRCFAQLGRSKGTLTSAFSPVLTAPGSPSAKSSSSRDQRGASTGESRRFWDMLEGLLPLSRSSALEKYPEQLRS